MHHAVSDGWSLGVLLRDLDALYTSATRGEPAVLAPLPVRYVDYAAWQRRLLDGTVRDEQLAYWTGGCAVRLPRWTCRPIDRGHPCPDMSATGSACACRPSSPERSTR